MFNLKASRKRWKQAQKSEYQDWVSLSQIVENEWEEIVVKYQSYLKKLSRRLKIDSSWKILDVGCGPTCICRLFKKGKLYGIDPLAKKLDLDKQVREVKIIEAQGEKIPFDDEFFNLVICRNVIDHSRDPYKLVGEIQRVLKKNGIFILSGYTYTSFITFIKTASEFIPKLRNVPHPYTFSPKSLEDLVASKFRIMERKVIHAGLHPNDYGKVDEEVEKRSVMQKIVLFFNFRVFKYNWFVKELLFICRKKA